VERFKSALANQVGASARDEQPDIDSGVLDWCGVVRRPDLLGGLDGRRLEVADVDVARP